MVKEIVLIILLFNGELKLTPLPFKGTMMECLEHGDKMRIELATYDERNIWFLNNRIGMWQGFICQ